MDFGLSRRDRITVSVYDASGRLVREFVSRDFAPGNGGFTGARKLTVLK